jgi:Na+-driven multidrug efflux pump
MAPRALRRPDPPPLETDDVHVVAVGTALWGLGLAVLLVLRVTGAVEVRGWWIAMCVAGIVLGLLGVRYCQRRRAAIARDAALGLPPRE